MANDASDREPFIERLRVPKSLTSDDVLLHSMESRVEPDDVDVSMRVSRNVELNIPILSTAMDTVTEGGMAIGMIRKDGLGVLHRNMSAEQMVREIGRVKRADRLVIRRKDVVTASPGQTIGGVDETIEYVGVSDAPVIDDDDVVPGIISGIDIRPYLEVGESNEMGEVMTGEVITVERDVTVRDALELIYDHKIECVPIVDDDGRLVGLATTQDILQRREHEDAARDDDDRLVCGIAVGPFGDKHAQMAGNASAGVIFIDCARVHNLNVIDIVRGIKGSVEADMVVGDVDTHEAAAELVDPADGIKAGIGPGSVCTTRVISGSGMSQISVVTGVADVAADHDIPVIADSDIHCSGGTIRAVAVGADVVMLGSYFVGTDEAPGRVITMNGKKYKQYRGMGSIGAIQSGGVGRYLKEGNEDEEYVPEGVEAVTPYEGSLASELHQFVGSMQSDVSHVGAETTPEIKKRARFVRISATGQTEGHPHGMMITDEAPNYSPSE